MAKLLKLRRGTTTQHNSFTGAEGEVTVDTTKDALVVHDGSTQGGHPVAKSSDIAGYAALTGATFTGDVLIDNAQELRLGEADGSGTNFTAFKAQAQSGDITLTLPAVAPTANQVLKADGSTPTTLTWASDVALTLLDEDDFSSDSATAVPSQQSTKAYIAATSQPLDADLTSLAGCQSGAAAALALLTSTEVAALDGFTGDKDDLIYAKDLKATGVTATEFDYLDGVTSAIQTQLDAKQASDADTAKTDVDQEWSKPQRGNVVDNGTHSSGTTADFDLDAGNNFKIDIDAAVELGFSNLDASREGQTGTIYVDNAAITPTWGAEVQFEGGATGTISITQSAKSVLAYYVLPGGAKVLVTPILDVKDD